MASYQHDFKENDITTLDKVFKSWMGSTARRGMVVSKQYYDGANTTINQMKRLYYSDGHLAEKVDAETGERTQSRVGAGMVENPYVSNFKIGYAIFHDVVAQKVNTLLDEAPIIQGTNAARIDQMFIKNLGYALKGSGTNASVAGCAFIFEGADGTLQVFESEDCVPFYDDKTGRLRALYRFWKITDMAGNVYNYAEEFNESNIIDYKQDGAAWIEESKVNYSSRIITDITGETEESMNLGYLPIVLLKNDSTCTSDLRPSTRAKIDAIDIVNSGFANNIEDFADAYWTIKTGNSSVNREDFEDFIASINRTKKIIAEGEGGDAEPHQFEVPTTARTTFVDARKKELIEETGVIDTASMTGSSLTTTAIKAATMKLRQRVTDFEWEVYQAALELLSIYCEYNGIDNSDLDIEFTQLLIQNDTELVDNAVKVRGDISKESYLGLLQRAGIIDNVQDELKRIEEEDRDSFKIEDTDPFQDIDPLGDDDDGGQGTPTD